MAGRIIVTAIFTFIPELFFSWIVGKFFDVSMWYIFLGLQIVSFFLWIIRTTVGYFLFHLVWKNGMIDPLYCSLVQNQYPDPQKYLGSPISEYVKESLYSGSDYFLDVMWDDEIDIKTRIDSAVTYGTIKGTAQSQGILGRLRQEKVTAKAVEKYHKVNFSGRDYQEI